jgi:hypothetical protein
MVAKKKHNGINGNGNGNGGSLKLQKGDTSAAISGALPLALACFVVVLIIIGYIALEVIKTTTEANAKMMTAEIQKVGNSTVQKLDQILSEIKTTAILDSVRKDCARMNGGR